MNIDLKSETEANLLQRIAERESDAIGKLYDMAGSWIFSLALNIVKNKSDAEEVTQEVFLQIWEKAHHYRADLGSVRSWLAIMTRRLAIDRTRGRQYKEQMRSTSEQNIPTDLTGNKGEKEILNSAEKGMVKDALARLDNGNGEALVLSYYHGFSHSEIAEKLSLPLGTVKSRIRNGMNQLRELLNIKVN